MPSTSREAPLGVLAVGLVEQPHRREAPLAGEQLVRAARPRPVSRTSGGCSRPVSRIETASSCRSSSAPVRMLVIARTWCRRRGDRPVRLGRGVGHAAARRRSSPSASRALRASSSRSCATCFLGFLELVYGHRPGHSSRRFGQRLDRIPERRGGPARTRGWTAGSAPAGPRGRARSGRCSPPARAPRPATRTCRRPARACAGSGRVSFLNGGSESAMPGVSTQPGCTAGGDPGSRLAHSPPARPACAWSARRRSRACTRT